MKDGKVRYVAASNYTAPRLAEALAISRRERPRAVCRRPAALQPRPSRGVRRRPARSVRKRERSSCVPYFALASGFLTGKYRPGVTVDSPRARGSRSTLDERGSRASMRSTNRRGASHNGRCGCARLAARRADDCRADRERTNKGASWPIGFPRRNCGSAPGKSHDCRRSCDPRAQTPRRA